MDDLAPQIAAALIYVGNRQVPFHPQAWRLVIDGFQRLMQSLSFNPDLIAGIETAGIPHGAALAYQMGKPFVFVRKQAKDHGAKKLVEGGDVEGKRVEHCFAISSYGFPEAAQQFGDAHVQLHTLVTLPTILDSARKQGRFGESELAVLQDWVGDPHGWAERQGSGK